MAPGRSGPTNTGPISDERWLVGLRSFFSIAKAWSLSLDEQAKILGVGIDELSGLEDGRSQQANLQILRRVSHVLAIFKGINTLLPIESRADAWMRAPNAASIFQGQSAIQYITSGDEGALRNVREYVDSQLS